MALTHNLTSFKVFLGRVWALAVPFFRSEQRWQARGLLAAIVALNLAAVYMLVLLNDWNRLFYDALQERNEAVFWRELLRFGYLAFGFIVIAVYRFYLTQLLEVRWRAWMTRHTLGRWLSDQRFTAWSWPATAAPARPPRPTTRISASRKTSSCSPRTASR
jgi:putative ATP-binding cassette transporter